MDPSFFLPVFGPVGEERVASFLHQGDRGRVGIKTLVTV